MFENSTPSVNEVITRYDLKYLLPDGCLDLQLTNSGDIALTDDRRDLRVGNLVQNAIFRLVQMWRYQTGPLGNLFIMLEDGWSVEESLDVELDALPLFTAFPKDLNREMLDRYHEINDYLAALEMSRLVYAGTIMVSLVSMLRRYWKDLHASPSRWSGSGPSFGGQAFGPLIEAAANSFRHEDEWARAKVHDGRQNNSITILTAALKDERPVIRNACPEVLALIAENKLENLGVSVFEFAKALCTDNPLAD